MICKPNETFPEWRERYSAIRACYIAGEMTVDVFLAKLHGLGFRGVELTAELSLARDERTHTKAARTGTSIG